MTTANNVAQHPRNYFVSYFRQNTDPLDDPMTVAYVKPGMLWIMTESDSPPRGLPLGAFVCNDDGDDWDPFPGTIPGGGSFVPLTEKGAADGVAELDGDGKVPVAQLPARIITDVFPAADEAAQLALTAEEGDVAIRADEGGAAYMHNGGTAGTMADWTPLNITLSLVNLPTDDEKAALAGTEGDPSDTNRYVTDEDPRLAVVAPADLYIDDGTGDDTTGTGLVGAPYATLAKALSRLPDVIAEPYTIHVVDGTYAEPIDVRRFVCVGEGAIKITGNTTTPANVTFTGVATFMLEGDATWDGCAVVVGPVALELEGIRTNATAFTGVSAIAGARLILDRCEVAGTTTYGVLIREDSHLEIHGDVDVSGFASAGGRGIFVAVRSTGIHATAGTLTITGPGGATTSEGIDVAYGSQWRAANGQTGINVTITGVKYGIYVAVGGSGFQHHTTSSTITIDNATTPTDSHAIHSGESASLSIVGPDVEVDHFLTAFYSEFKGVMEVLGSRTITNVTNLKVANDLSFVLLSGEQTALPWGMLPTPVRGQVTPTAPQDIPNNSSVHNIEFAFVGPESTPGTTDAGNPERLIMPEPGLYRFNTIQLWEPDATTGAGYGEMWARTSGGSYVPRSIASASNTEEKYAHAVFWYRATTPGEYITMSVYQIAAGSVNRELLPETMIQWEKIGE